MEINAQVVAYSTYRNANSNLLTQLIDYPRFITAQLNTHKMLEKNSSSSRAIPVKTIITMLEKDGFVPKHWGKNQSGMQASEQLNDSEIIRAVKVWQSAKKYSIEHVLELVDNEGLNVHKELANRLLEPYAWMRTVITGTDWNNFYWLRADSDAQPEFHELASKMKQAHEQATPVVLEQGEWHTPFYKDGFWKPVDGVKDVHGHTLDEALRISASCCAQTSYRRSDDSLEKADKIFNMLNLGVKDKKAHSSPTGHQGTPIINRIGRNTSFNPDTWDKGITHVRRDGQLCSGNLRGWIQYRQLIPYNTMEG